MTIDRRAALAELNKATIDRPMVNDGLLNPEQSEAFIRTIKESTAWLSSVPLLRRRSPSGEINKLATGGRIIRAATENADDGYRAQATFPVITYEAKKIRLPWEITNDALLENIEGTQLEADLAAEMTDQFGLDMEDLATNGDTAATGADAAFLNIRDGWLKRLKTQDASSVINGAAINGGVFSKDHFFALYMSMPNRYRTQRGLEWIMSPNRAASWWESLTDRNTAAGDSALAGMGGDGAPGDSAIRGPLGLKIRVQPTFPDSKVALASPQNFRNIVTRDVVKYSVGPQTDAELAAKDKRFYVFFVKNDVIYVEGAGIRVAEGLTAPV